MNELDINDVKAVERYLLRLSSDEGIGELAPANVQLEVLEAGQWILKFRRHNIIVNKCELVLRDGIKIDASISFFTLGNFWATINGGMSLEEGAMSTSGSEAAMSLFRSKVLKTKSTPPAPPNPASPVPSSRVLRPTTAADDNLPLRSGWLLKRRDLFTGWRSRYFKVYVGRAEYFIEPGDPVPHATIDLFNAKVTPVAEIRINGQGRSYQIIVEPKKSEKCFKLASELTGEDGKQDAESWYMTFELATKPHAQALALLSGTKASPMPADKSSAAGAASAAATPGSPLKKESLAAKLDAADGGGGGKRAGGGKSSKQSAGLLGKTEGAGDASSNLLAKLFSWATRSGGLLFIPSALLGIASIVIGVLKSLFGVPPPWARFLQHPQQHPADDSTLWICGAAGALSLALFIAGAIVAWKKRASKDKDRTRGSSGVGSKT